MPERADGMAILLTAEPGESHWQLGRFPTDDGLGVMIGWNVESPDGGIPATVSLVLARTLTQLGRVTFPSSKDRSSSRDGWQMFGEDAVTQLAIADRRPWRTNTIPLRSTSREEVARDLFDDPHFQWWNASQFAFVSRPRDVPPRLVEPLPSALLEDNWAATLGQLRQAGVQAILRSGVDGDVCGIAFESRAIRAEFEGLLGASASASGYTVRTLSSAEFVHAL